LPPDRLNELKEGLLSGAEMISALEHIGECEQCAGTLAESYGSLELLELPTDFKQAVLSAVNRQYRTAGQKQGKTDGGKNNTGAHSGKRELFRYGFKVSVAACITLLLLFTGTINYGIDFGRSIHTDLSEVNLITENLRGFSDRLIHFEVTEYLKEEF
jgi:hypothetical protein